MEDNVEKKNKIKRGALTSYPREDYGKHERKICLSLSSVVHSVVCEHVFSKSMETK